MTCTTLLALNRPAPAIEPADVTRLVQLCWPARFHERADALVEGLGLDQLFLQGYDRSRFRGGSVFFDFVDVVGIDGDGLVDSSPVVNRSMTLEAVAAVEDGLGGDDGVPTDRRRRLVEASRDLAEMLGGLWSILRLSTMVVAADLVSEDFERLLADHPDLESLRTSLRAPASDPDTALVARYRELLVEHLALPGPGAGRPIVVDGSGTGRTVDGAVEFRVGRWDRVVHVDRFVAIVTSGDGRAVRIPVRRCVDAATPRFAADVGGFGACSLRLVAVGSDGAVSAPEVVR